MNRRTIWKGNNVHTTAAFATDARFAVDRSRNCRLDGESERGPSSTAVPATWGGERPERLAPRTLPCQRHDPDLWFADAPADLDHAKQLCGDCPVRVACLAGAISRNEPAGVWGGQIFHDGVIIPNKRPRGRPRKNPRPSDHSPHPVDAVAAPADAAQSRRAAST